MTKKCPRRWFLADTASPDPQPAPEQCPKHPMSASKAEVERLKAEVERLTDEIRMLY